MTLTLHLDTPAWREHLVTTRDATPGIVPVAKGNGYGYGLARLAHEAELLGVRTLAVGTSPEIAKVGDFSGDLVVLTPWSHFQPAADEVLDREHVIITVSRIDELAEVARRKPGKRVIVELLTSMKRHGITAADLPKVAKLAEDLTFEGWTIHLPMKAADALGEARQLAEGAITAVPAPIWLSHLNPTDYATLASELSVETRLRMGTKLWLGAPKTRRTTATVLDMHPVKRGERIGYWQHRARTDGWVVVLSGGTAHGVALTAPTSGATLKQRAVTAATGVMDASGVALSPFTLAGRKRMFVEPPHMQSSLVFLPGAGAVAVGDEVPVELRLTTATVDRIVEG